MHDDFPVHPRAGFGGPGQDEAEIQRAIEESLRMGGVGAYNPDDELQRILEMSKKEFWYDTNTLIILRRS
jgi:hypothetical protein